MRRSAVSAGRPGGLIREITWKAGRLEVICCQVPFPVFICLSEKNLYIRDCGMKGEAFIGRYQYAPPHF